MKVLAFREQRTHGTMEFPFAYYRIGPAHPRYGMVHHWHAEYELLRVCSGHFALTVDGCTHEGKAGDVFFISAGALHGGVPKTCEYECLVFDLAALAGRHAVCRQALLPVLQGRRTVRARLPGALPVAPLLDAFTAPQGPAGQMGTVGALYTLLAAIVEEELYEDAAAPAPPAVRQLARFREVLTLIKTRYHEDLDLDDLAGAAGMNPRYFCRWFREMTHKTPVEYLNYYRVECAAEALLLGDKSVTETALDCGFGSLSYFIRVFKKHKGLSPRRYVQSNAPPGA